MLYAWINGEKRQPLAKGERTDCDCCGGTLIAVLPVENVKHWRHKAGDCDAWSEPEGEWHLNWKEYFDLTSREIIQIDDNNGEKHRADILCGLGTSAATVLELQHSSISEDERIARETFYQQNNKMFWLVHIHSDTAFNEFAFGSALSLKNEIGSYGGRTFYAGYWASRSSQFIEKWKRSTAHVFFDFRGFIYFLASSKICNSLNYNLSKGEFAVCELTRQEFIDAVKGVK